MGWYAKERARDRIAELAGRGLDLPTLWREASDAMAAAVPHYMSPCWFTFDPASLLVTSHYEPRFRDNERRVSRGQPVRGGPTPG